MHINNNYLSLVTHDGPLHADEALAVGWMIYTHPLMRIDLDRTRDEAKLLSYMNDGKSLLIDVGGRCNLDKGWLDHHMPEDRPTWAENGQPMASAGLALHYVCKTHKLEKEELPDELIELFQNVDSIDNNGIAPLGFQFSKLVAECNPCGVNTTKEEFDNTFLKVVRIIQLMLSGMCSGQFIGFEEAQRFFEIQAEPMLAAHRKELADSALRLKNYIQAWRGSSTLILENFEPAAKLMLSGMNSLRLYAFPIITGDGYIVKAAPKSSFLFPEKWRGLAKEADLKLADAPDGVQYCHHTGFLCKVASREAAARLLQRFK